MGVIADPPPRPAVSPAGFGSGAGRTPGESTNVGPESPRSPIAESFAGWMCLAESATDLSPGIGDLMRSAGQLARSVIESQAGELADQIVRRMTDRDNGIPPSVLATAVRGLLDGDRLPLSPAAAARQLAESIGELDEEDVTLLHGLSGTLGYVAGENITGLMMVAAGARIASEAAGVAAPRPGQSSDDYYFGGSGPRWFFTASLELPASIGDQVPMQCFHRRHGVSGDRICITESTFNNRDVENTPLRSERRQPSQVDGEYRATLNDDEVTEFANILPAQTLRQGSYVCRVVIEPDSRAARTVSRLVNDHRADIASVTDAAVQAAKGTILVVHPLAAVALPLVDLLAGLAGNICAHLVEALGRLVEPRSLPSWLISHTVVWAEDSPLSIFLLRCSDEPRSYVLHGIRRRSDDARTVISDDYRYLDKTLYNAGRLMWGASRPNSMLPGMPDDLWSVVSEEQQPVVWTDPDIDHRGFRVLVPQRLGKARYVTALRADIRFN